MKFIATEYYAFLGDAVPASCVTEPTSVANTGRAEGELLPLMFPLDLDPQLLAFFRKFASEAKETLQFLLNEHKIAAELDQSGTMSCIYYFCNFCIY